MTVYMYNKTFTTIEEAAEELQADVETIIGLCKNPKYPECYMKGVKRIPRCEIFSEEYIPYIRKTDTKRRSKYARRVLIRGTEYISVKEAEKWIDANSQTIWNRLNDPKRTDYQWINETLEERFWSQVDIKDKNECWLWKGSNGVGGYGSFSIKGPVPAHRVSWEITYGPIPVGAHVRHAICDNRKCVNPHHLSLGTPRENMYDIDKYLLIPFPPEESIQFPTDIKDRSRDWLFVGSTKRQRITNACNAILHN